MSSQNPPIPSSIHTPDSIASTPQAQASTNPPVDPYPYLRQLYHSDQPIGNTTLNAVQALTLWRELHSALDTIASLQTSSQASIARVGDLQHELDQAREEELVLHSQKHDYEQELTSLRQQLQQAQQTNGRLYTPPPILSTEHPDPAIFDGSDPSLLPDFILQTNVKLNINADRYPNRLSRIAYFVSRLASGALKQVKFGITATGDFTFGDVNELTQVLETAYGDAAPRATAGVAILKLKQYKQPLQQFLPEWHQTAHESGFDDIALITILKDALHFMIIERLSYTPASFSTTSLPEFLDMVRNADSTLRMLYPHYHKTTPASYSHGTSATKPTPAPPLSTPLLPAPFTTSDGGDAMDLSAIWTGSMGGKRRPKNDAERKARREYCFKNNLCLFCESLDHRIDACPIRPKNPRQTRQSATTTTTQTEN